MSVTLEDYPIAVARPLPVVRQASVVSELRHLAAGERRYREIAMERGPLPARSSIRVKDSEENRCTRPAPMKGSDSWTSRRGSSQLVPSARLVGAHPDARR